MSRSNPTANNPNPTTRWFEWSGSNGCIQWFDKTKDNPKTKQKGVNVSVKVPFAFIVLDDLHTITGYSKQLKSGVTANEVRDLRADVLHARYHKAGPIASGLYADIKEKVKAASGKFASSVYIAYRDGSELKLGNLRIAGASLGPWIDFKAAHRKELLEKGVVITGSVDDVNGDVEFKRPVFAIKDILPATNEAAIKLDHELQTFLKSYFEKARGSAPSAGQTAEAAALPSGRAAVPPPNDPETPEVDPDEVPVAAADDDVPF